VISLNKEVYSRTEKTEGAAFKKNNQSNLSKYIKLGGK